MKKQWSPPSEWQDFEELCYRLFTAEYKSKQSFKYGRAGQAQHGVDIALLPATDTNWTCIQCKVKDDLLDSRLTPDDVLEEYSKSKRFSHTIEKYIIATTAMPDTKPQDEAMRLTSHFASAYPIEVKFWTDIESLLEEHSKVAKLFYPERFADDKAIASDAYGNVAISMSPDDWENRLQIFLNSPEFRSATRGYDNAFYSILAELIDNCRNSTKGNAKTIRLALSGQVLRIEDDGVPFDVTNTNVNLTERMMGVRTIRRMLEKHAGISYVYYPADLTITRFNRTDLIITPTQAQFEEPKCWASAPTTFLMHREMGKRFVENLVIGDDCEEYVLTLFKGTFFSASTRDAVIVALLEKLNGIPLRIRVSKDCGDAFEEMMWHAETYENVIFEEI